MWRLRRPTAMGLFLAVCCAQLSTPLLEAQSSSELILGRHYFAIENLDTGNVDRRGLTGDFGVAFSNVILGVRVKYRIWILNAETLEIGRTEIETGGPGSRIVLPPFELRRHNTFDADNDRLPDLGEFIVGSDMFNPDTDGDGILDGVEVLQGGSPLDGTPVLLGLLATVAAPTPAVDLAIAGDLLVVAHEQGFIATTVFSGMTPAILAAVPATGTVTRIAADGSRVALVAGPDGLQIADLSTPATAAVVQTLLPFELPVDPTFGFGDPTCVAATAGVAYVGLSNGIVAAVDLFSATVFSQVDLGEPVADLAIESEVLYAVSGNTLTTITLDPNNMQILGSGSAATVGGYSRVTAGGGFAYGVHDRGVNPYNVTNPATPGVILATNSPDTVWNDIALNGSGVGIAAAGPSVGLEGLQIYDVTNFSPADDPTLSARLITTLITPGIARSVVVANGFTYVADDTEGLQVVKVVADDTAEVPPTITLDANFDLMAAAAEEGSSVRFTALVSDDFAVRNVEFFVDDVPTVDATFPFEHRFTAPLVSDQPSFRIRARAFDIGGNSTTTDELVITLSPDVTPPQFVRGIPEGGAIGPIADVLGIFSEPLDPATLSLGAFNVTSAGPDNILLTADDVLLSPTLVEYRPGPRALAWSSAQLAPGRYLAEVDFDVTDLAGNGLSRAARWAFTVYDNPDLDMDGIPDGLLDPDGDGLITAYELILGLDPNVADFDPMSDLDGDGITDLNELVLGTDPNNADSDQDGFSDGDELGLGSEALDPISIPIFTSITTISVQNIAPVGLAVDQISVLNQGGISISLGLTSVDNRAAPEAIDGETVPRVVSVENLGTP